MTKRKVSENSLRNLEEHKGQFANSSEFARNAQEQSVKSRKERQSLKEELLLLLSKGDVQKKISLALIEQAKGGSIRAFETIRDTIGEKPTDRQELKPWDIPIIIDNI